jgi:hypothetical protein
MTSFANVDRRFFYFFVGGGSGSTGRCTKASHVSVLSIDCRSNNRGLDVPGRLGNP